MLSKFLKSIAFLFISAAVFSAGTLPQAFAQNASGKNAAKLEKLPGNNFNAAWPKVTKIPDMLPAETVKEEGRTNIYETEHFQFICSAPIQNIREVARIFEGTYVANLMLPINSPCNYYQVSQKGKLKAYLHETRQDYLKALGPAGKGLMKNSAGVCRTTNSMERSEIHVPFASLGLKKAKTGGSYKVFPSDEMDPKTLAHELTHFMSMPGYNSTYPIWFCEGLAEYVGISYYGGGRFNFNNREKVVQYATAVGRDGKGGRNLGKTFRCPVSLEKFLKQDQQRFLSGNVQFSYGFSLLLVYYFFHLDGKKDAARIKEFLKVCQQHGSQEEAYKKLLDGRSWQDLEKDVARGLKSLKINVQF